MGKGRGAAGAWLKNLFRLGKKEAAAERKWQGDGRIAGQHVRSAAAVQVARELRLERALRPARLPAKATAVPHWKRKQRNRQRNAMAKASRRANR